VVEQHRCSARVWGNGLGGQCRHSQQEWSQFCWGHATNSNWQTHGRIDDAIPDKKLQEFLKASGRAPPAASSTPRPKKKRNTGSEGSPTTPAPLADDAAYLKKPMFGAFGAFMAENRNDIKASRPADHQGNMIGYIGKEASLRWKALPEEERQAFQNKFEDQIAEYKAAPEEMKAPKGLKALKAAKEAARAPLKPDGTALKRPAGGGYGVFLIENRASISASLPADHQKITDVAKQAGVLWKDMPEDEKKVLAVKFEEKMAAYKEAWQQHLLTEKGKLALAAASRRASFMQGSNLLKLKRKRAW